MSGHLSKGISSFGCDKCGLVGCDCAARAAVQAKQEDVCKVCRRSELRCICLSHHHVPDIHDETIERREHTKQATERTPHYVESQVQEALHYYYQRDAEGLARWVRRRLA